jgi:diguanylate cyclase (GGDEF)-like protein
MDGDRSAETALMRRFEEQRAELDHLSRSNEDLRWLLRFSESLHELTEPDTMFKWLCRELGALGPILCVELVSLTGAPVVRIGDDTCTKAATRRDVNAVAQSWSEALSSRYELHAQAAEIKVKRFHCLPGASHGHLAAGAGRVRKAETPLCHGGQVLGVLTVCLPARQAEDRRIDALVASLSGQIGLFLHQHAEREKIRSLANHDALTGLLNHMSFQDIFEREFERHRRHERSLSLLFIDIDHFKRINDQYGHQAGDQVLREVARILASSLRKIDYVFRYGGDEFVVLMTETDVQRATMLGHRIRGAVKREIAGGAPSGNPVSVSIGIAECSALTPIGRDELLFRADGALYQAKNAGRDRIQVATPPFAGAQWGGDSEESPFSRTLADPYRFTQKVI